LGRGAPAGSQGQGPGPGAAGPEQQVGRGRSRAAGGWPEKCRPGGPGRRVGLREPSCSPQATTPRSASSRRGRLSTSRNRRDKDGQLPRQRRTNERTDRGRRAGTASERGRAGRRRREGGEQRARPRPPCGLDLAPVAVPRTRAHSAQPRLLRSASTP
jgi:hypothetical protein